MITLPTGLYQLCDFLEMKCQVVVLSYIFLGDGLFYINKNSCESTKINLVSEDLQTSPQVRHTCGLIA